MKKEHKKTAFMIALESRLPCMDQDNQGRWFVAKKSATGIEIEIMADEEAARSRLATLLFEPNTQPSRPADNA